jgi:hypothetical protein
MEWSEQFSYAKLLRMDILASLADEFTAFRASRWAHLSWMPLPGERERAEKVSLPIRRPPASALRWTYPPTPFHEKSSIHRMTAFVSKWSCLRTNPSSPHIARESFQSTPSFQPTTLQPVMISSIPLPPSKKISVYPLLADQFP